MNNTTPPAEKPTHETVTRPSSVRTEWIAVMHGEHGTVKIAYRSPVLLAKGLRDQTREGWVVASVYERERVTYADE
jgi:hypothetical protein